MNCFVTKVPRWLYFFQYSFFSLLLLLLLLMFDVLLFEIPTKSIVHTFLFCWSRIVAACRFKWKRILYEEKLWKIIFRLKMLYCVDPLRRFDWKMSPLKKKINKYWTHARQNQPFFCFFGDDICYYLKLKTVNKSRGQTFTSENRINSIQYHLFVFVFWGFSRTQFLLQTSSCFYSIKMFLIKT